MIRKYVTNLKIPLSSTCAELEQGLDNAVAQVLGELQRDFPSLTAIGGSFVNEVFPFSYTASLNLYEDPTRDADVVISINIKPEGALLICDSDISGEPGPILLDGPTVRVPEADVTHSAEFASWAKQVASFIITSVGTIRQRLAAQPNPS